ncbi:neutral zinc metallopeptidase [Helcobacillus massiliensis]|uniref:Neutral zinc metallopeptidase n=1 Tax=Helcobacillus massiliensis TaxID=521392 RepID=A0A839R0F4_9MICO|nr:MULTISPECIES: neutral zinc metallopeptidase [Helcobacillus]MBB3023217.1 hypothetical protein [Helcobacillus massiliensis]MCG7428046.1 neutral zinc metallopeptidase [Helcobacillus sp. ACRRO]MCT1556607.1 neutral zinc metallopeptidase [Helcobacillus massiliensis]MCT2035801.1 neutral zinc metallopeptidase [Helcobacillus massiliensis]MCT2331117.1 neutral zinc metallopeptidase [Helcobacillus massiliensis]
MTFNPNANIGSGNVGRAGGGGGFGGGGLPLGPLMMLGGGGGGTIVLIILFLLFSGMFSGGGGGGQEQQSAQGGALEHCQTGKDANEKDDCYVQAVVETADAFWQQEAKSAGFTWKEPQGRVFSGSVSTGCGAASSDTGPFYCPADSTIYVDVSFFDELSSRFGANQGQLAKAYVVAHEYGHHIQNLDGTMNRINRRDTGPKSDQVALELQADCYAGVWARNAVETKDPDGNRYMEPLTEQDVKDALSAASAVGDDHIQGEVAGGRVQPDTWTHGSSEKRQQWFITGYNEGSYGACDTFSNRG